MSETIYLQPNEFNASNKTYTTIFYSYLIFKLKIKQKGDETAVNQSKIKKDVGKNIEFYRKSREICYASAD